MSSLELPQFTDSEESDGSLVEGTQRNDDFLGGRGLDTGFFPRRSERPMSDFLGRGTGADNPLPPTAISTAQLRALQDQLSLDDYDDIDEGSDYAPWDEVEDIMADVEAQLDMPRGMARVPGLGPSENLSRMLAQLLGLGPRLGGPAAGGAGLEGLELDGVPQLQAAFGMGGDAAAAAAAERRHALNMLDWGFPTAADPARHAALAAEGVPAGRMERAAPRETLSQGTSAGRPHQPRPAEFPPGHPFRRLGDMPNAQPVPRGFWARFSQQQPSLAAEPGFNPDEPPGLTSSDDEWDLPLEPARRWRHLRAPQLVRGGSGSGGWAAAAQARAAAAGRAGAAAAAGRGSDDMPDLITDASSEEDSEGEGSDNGHGGRGRVPVALRTALRQSTYQPRRGPTRSAQPGSSAAAAVPARQGPQQHSRAPAAPRAAGTGRLSDDEASMPSLISEDEYLTDSEEEARVPLSAASEGLHFPGAGRYSGSSGRQGTRQLVAQQAGQRAQQAGRRTAAQQAQRDPLQEMMQRVVEQQVRLQQAGQQAQQRAARPRRNAIFGALPGLSGQQGLLLAELLGRGAAGSRASAAGPRSAGNDDSDVPPLLASDPDTDSSEWESEDSGHDRSGYLDSSDDDGGSEAGGRSNGSGFGNTLPPLIDSDEDSEAPGGESGRAPWLPGRRPAGQLARQGSGGSEAAGEADATAAEEATLLEVLGRRLGSMHGSEAEEGGGDDGMPELEPLEAGSSGAAAEGGPAAVEQPGAAAREEEVVQVAANSASPSPATVPAAPAAAVSAAAAGGAAAAAAEAQPCRPEEAAQQAVGSAALGSLPMSWATLQASSLPMGAAPPAASAVASGAAAGVSQGSRQLPGHSKQHCQQQQQQQQQHARLARLPETGLELAELSPEIAAAPEAAVQPQPGKERAPGQAEIGSGASSASCGVQQSQWASSSGAEAPSGSKGSLQQQQQLSAGEFFAAADSGLAGASERGAAVAEPAVAVGEPAAVGPRTTAPSVVVRLMGAGSNLIRWFSGGQC